MRLHSNCVSMVNALYINGLNYGLPLNVLCIVDIVELCDDGNMKLSTFYLVGDEGSMAHGLPWCSCREDISYIVQRRGFRLERNCPASYQDTQGNDKCSKVTMHALTLKHILLNKYADKM